MVSNFFFFSLLSRCVVIDIKVDRSAEGRWWLPLHLHVWYLIVNTSGHSSTLSHPRTLPSLHPYHPPFLHSLHPPWHTLTVYHFVYVFWPSCTHISKSIFVFVISENHCIQIFTRFDVEFFTDFLLYIFSKWLNKYEIYIG